MLQRMLKVCSFPFDVFSRNKSLWKETTCIKVVATRAICNFSSGKPWSRNTQRVKSCGYHWESLRTVEISISVCLSASKKRKKRHFLSEIAQKGEFEFTERNIFSFNLPLWAAQSVGIEELEGVMSCAQNSKVFRNIWFAWQLFKLNEGIVNCYPFSSLGR